MISFRNTTTYITFIEENFLDDQSNGFQLESSRLRRIHALERLFLVLSVATLYLVMLGTTIVESGERKKFDPHFKRGLSYLMWLALPSPFFFSGWENYFSPFFILFAK